MTDAQANAVMTNEVETLFANRGRKCTATAVAVEKDGNCQIHAIRLGLGVETRAQIDVHQMRLDAVNWIDEHRRFLQPIYGVGEDPLQPTGEFASLRSWRYQDAAQSMEQFLTDQRINGTPCDTKMAIAMAHQYDLSLIIVTATSRCTAFNVVRLSESH